MEPLVLSTVADWHKAQPGLCNVAVLTLGPRLRYTRSLLRDLRDIAEKWSDEDLDRTSLGALFPHMVAAPEAISSHEHSNQSPSAPPLLATDQLAQTRLLHPSQRAAVVNSLAEPTSVVTGPPGT